MILAEGPATGIGWDVVLTLGVLTSLAVNVMTLMRMNQSQKREVTFSTEHPTKEFCLNSHAAIASRLNSLENAEAESAERRRQLYVAVDNVRKELKEDIQRVEDKVEVQPANVVRLLRETGVIK